MRFINVHNVNQGLSEGLQTLLHFGKEEPSRNGSVLVAPWPVVTAYQAPTHRVLFSPLRDANPYFHLMEALWMLAGDNDVAFPAFFAKRIKQYSDDGATIHGAYGYRWRRHFKFDQIPIIVEELKRNPDSRRAVLAMWDASAEHSAMAFGDAKDIPCNTHIYFRVRKEPDKRPPLQSSGGPGGPATVLDMTVSCRSNDIVWGAYGANAVHMSVLQEYVAACLGVQVGTYYQFSNNFHLYTDVVARKDIETLADDARHTDRYTYSVGPHNARPALPHIEQPVRVPLVTGTAAQFDTELRRFMVDPMGDGSTYTEPFFSKVAAPMYRSWHAHKEKAHDKAFIHAMEIGAEDWRIACTEWLRRREDNRAAKRHAKEVENGNANA